MSNCSAASASRTSSPSCRTTTVQPNLDSMRFSTRVLRDSSSTTSTWKPNCGRRFREAAGADVAAVATAADDGAGAGAETPAAAGATAVISTLTVSPGGSWCKAGGRLAGRRELDAERVALASESSPLTSDRCAGDVRPAVATSPAPAPAPVSLLAAGASINCGWTYPRLRAWCGESLDDPWGPSRAIGTADDGGLRGVW